MVLAVDRRIDGVALAAPLDVRLCAGGGLADGEDPEIRFGAASDDDQLGAMLGLEAACGLEVEHLLGHDDLAALGDDCFRQFELRPRDHIE